MYVGVRQHEVRFALKYFYEKTDDKRISLNLGDEYLGVHYTTEKILLNKSFPFVNR